MNYLLALAQFALTDIVTNVEAGNIYYVAGIIFTLMFVLMVKEYNYVNRN